MPRFHVRPDRSAPRRYPTARREKSDNIPPAPPKTQIRPPRPGEPRRENSAPGSLNLGTAQKNFLRKGDGSRASSPAPGSRPSSRPPSRLRTSSPAPGTAFAPDLQASMKNMEDFLKHADELLERTKAAQAEVATAGEWNLPEWMRQIRDPPLVTPAQMRAGMAPTAVRVPETPAATPATVLTPAATPATAPFSRPPHSPGSIPGVFVSEDFSSSMRSVMDTVRRVAKATGSEQLRAQAEALDSQMTREAEVEAHDAQTRSSWYPQTASSAAILNAPLARSDAEALAESLRVAADAAAADARTRTHIESKKARGQKGGEAKSLRERLRSITDSVAKLRGDGGRGESARRRGGAYFYRDDDDEDDRETDYAISDDDAGGAGARMDVRRMDAEVQAAMSRSSSRAARASTPGLHRVESSARVRSAPVSRLGARVGSRRDLSRLAFERAAAGHAGHASGATTGATDGWWSRPGSRAGRNRTNPNAYADAGVGDFNVRDGTEDLENVDPDGYDRAGYEDAPIVNKESLAAAVAAAMAVANSMRPPPPPPPPMTDEEREENGRLRDELAAENGRLRETVRRLRSELGVANRLVMGYHAQLMTGGSCAPRFGDIPETRRGDETTRAPSFKHRAPRAPFADAPADPPREPAWDDTTSLKTRGASSSAYVGGNGGGRSAWRAERKRRTAELETLQSERQIAEEAAAMDERVALDANEQLREEIGELREMMREVMRRQQTPRGLRPKPPVHPASPRATTTESPTRSHPRTHFHGEHFQGLYDETRGDEAGDKVTHGVRDPSPEPPDVEAEDPTSVRTSPYRSTG